MNYEIDFLPVGNGEKSGDAICIRWQDDNDNYKVMVVDGGTKESGEKIVEHIKKYYNTSTVDYVVNTHADQDHASGLSIVLEQLEVKELWIHRPWEHTEEILKYFDGRFTENSLKEKLEKSFRYVKPLENIAKEKNIAINEPFQGSQIGIFEVLSPSKEWYLHDLLPDFDKTPEKKEKHEVATESLITKALNWILESFDKETLKTDGETSADNESSAILYTNIDNNRGILLTGDAGSRALNKAYEYNPYISDNLRFIQVPHHGSRNNVNPDILDKLLGEKGQKEPNKTAFISVGKESSTHPRQSVVNAFIRRGCKVISTEGSTIHHHKGMPDRGWSKAESLKFIDKFEE